MSVCSSVCLDEHIKEIEREERKERNVLENSAKVMVIGFSALGKEAEKK